ncbi:MAG: HD domain-containing protein [bacterium]|nr:HD domain-containing protein [bacterium]
MELRTNSKMPQKVVAVSETLTKAGFEAYLIGGCVRDLIMGKVPKDWDLTTSARPEQILELFPGSFYENDFGTVGVVFENLKDINIKDKYIKDITTEVIEVTTYRLEAKYSDSRHPDSVTFSDTLADDLKRRDFTVNAIAYDVSRENTIDLFHGQEDIKDRVIRAVGDPGERFSEDALRMMRAVRFACELDFSISQETSEAICLHTKSLQNIAIERVRAELIRILESDIPMRGIEFLHELKLLPYIIPELERGIGIEQNQAHKYDVWGHNIRTAQHAADKGWDLDLRIAALFHDIGKPSTRRFAKERNDWTFHGHDVVGSRETRKIMERLKFPVKTIEKVSKLVRWHMFFSDPEKVTLSAVRRMVRNVGEENIWDLMNLRACDRIGTGRPKEQPYRFRKYKSMIEEALRSPTSVKMIAINGDKIMEITGLKPGHKVGYILHAMLEDILDDPTKNTPENLRNRTLELAQLSDEELMALGEHGRKRKVSQETEAVGKIRKKYWVE